MSQTQNSSQDAYKQWYIGGLQALEAANEIGKKTTQKLKKYVSSPDLLKAIEQGSEASRQHADTIKSLLQQAGGQPSGRPNEIMQGIDTAADQIAQSEDKDVRDAGVITSAQIALHYYLVAYGGLASTAKHLGLDDQAQQFSAMTDEVKKADDAYTQMAEQSINKQAAA